MKTTSTPETRRSGKQWLVLVFIALWVVSCGTDPSPQPKIKPNPMVQKMQNSGDWSDINTLNSRGLAPLHAAVMNKNLVMAQMLIKHGADVNLFSASKLNPLYYAAEGGQVQMVRLLLKSGADINGKSAGGWTPLLIAVERGHTEAAGKLIRSGADANTASDQGWTVLHTAASKGNIEILDLLIAYGGDVNTWQFPDTVLHWAAIRGQAEAAELLIQHGAGIDQMNLSGAMPLHLAISYSHKDVIKVLLDNGANPNVVASNGFTPLITAYKWPGVKDREGIAALLKQYGAK